MAWFSSKEAAATPGHVDTVIGAGAAFEGTLKTDNSVCVEGRFRGRIESAGRVIVNPAADIQADLVADYVTVNGTLVGNVTARRQLDLGETGRIQGDVEAGAVTVAKGGVLEGTCRMAQPQKAPAAENVRAKGAPQKRPVAAGVVAAAS